MIPSSAKPIYDTWKSWLVQTGVAGHFSGPDRINTEQLNRYDWYSAHDWKVAYPGTLKAFEPFADEMSVSGVMDRTFRFLMERIIRFRCDGHRS